MEQDIYKDMWNSEVDESLRQLQDTMEECIGNIELVRENKQLLTVIRMRHEYWDRSWRESYEHACKDTDRILNPYGINLINVNRLKELQKTISETLFDTIEDLRNTGFCVVCFKEHGSLKLSYLLDEQESGNPDIVQ